VSAKPIPETSVFSDISPDYQRTPLVGGGFVPETYVVGKGVCMDQTGEDESLSKTSFRDVSHIIAEALARDDFVPAPEPKNAKLLIVFNWGRTTPFEGNSSGSDLNRLGASMNASAQTTAQLAQAQAFSPSSRWQNQSVSQAMFQLQQSQLSEQNDELGQMLALQQMDQSARERADLFNARLLGYHLELKRAAELKDFMLSANFSVDSVLDEIESPRYFVILQAYDFQMMLKEKTRKLLWTTRFSVSAKGHSFDEELRNMAMASVGLFGSDSKTLKRGLDSSRVEIGELEYSRVDE